MEGKSFYVIAKYGRTKDLLKQDTFTTIAKNWEAARSNAISFLRKQGYKVVEIEHVEEIEVEKREWQK